MPISFSGVSLSGTTIGYPSTTTFGNNLLFPNTAGQFLSIGAPTGLIDWRATTGFTCEYWFYYTGIGGATINGGPGNQNGSDTNYWSFGPMIDGSVQLYYWSPGQTFVATAPSLVTTNAWNNIALVCTTAGSTTTISIYVNGTRQTTTTTTAGVTSTGTVFGLGRYTSNILTGFMNNLRVSNINRYSGASYTLATTAFTTDANTQLLIQPTESTGTTITYQNSGAGGTMTNASSLVTATTTRANHT
jgi:hypothetical protein